jgi:DNA-binding transcriptional regulator YdaS (Cro superfamily)
MEPFTIPNRAAVAQAIGTSDQYLYQIESRRRLASKLMAEAIERVTEGAVPRQTVRPDIFPPEQRVAA